MKYKEFKKEVEYWGKIYNYKPTVNVGSIYIEILFEHVYYTNTVCTIHKSERCVMDLDWKLYRNLSENAKGHLFDLVTEFARTPLADREDEKSFIIPLPAEIAVPMKVIKRIYTEKHIGGRTIYIAKCPNCDSHLEYNSPSNYCRNCGQRLDWEVDEEIR